MFCTSTSRCTQRVPRRKASSATDAAGRTARMGQDNSCLEQQYQRRQPDSAHQALELLQVWSTRQRLQGSERY